MKMFLTAAFLASLLRRSTDFAPSPAACASSAIMARFSARHYGRFAVAAVLMCASASGAASSFAGLPPGHIPWISAGKTAPASGALSMRLRGGMGDAAAQMAEIRARRAKEYEALKAQREDSQARQAKEEAGYDGAQRAWTQASGKLDAKSIGTKQEDMAIGDARAFYKGKEITYLRNKNTGMVIELMHESEGWFQFCAVEQGKLKQVSAGGLLMDVNRWYAPGLLEQVKTNPLKATLVPTSGLTFGPWSCAPEGRQLVVARKDDSSKSIHLMQEGFVFVDHGTGRGLSVDSFGATKYVSTDEAERLLAEA